MSRSSEVRAVGHFFAYLIMRGTPINRSIWTCRRSNDLWQDAMKCRDERLEILWRMGWESTNVTGNWNSSGTGPVARSHHRANRTRSGTVPLRSHPEVVGSFRNDRTQWKRCEHGRPVAFRNGSGPKAVVWTWPNLVLTQPSDGLILMKPVYEKQVHSSWETSTTAGW